MIKLTDIHIRNYRGIEARDIEVPPHGFVAMGGNGRGKTSILRAIRAALAAQDIGPDAIRTGAEKAEILVDMGDYTVKRVITPKTSSLTVTKGGDGFKATKPQTLLTELLGTSPLDPLNLFLAKPKDRRAIILEALPVTVTRDALVKYAPTLPADFDARGHGLDVVARARKIFYDRRTDANREVADAERAEATARGASERAAAVAGAAKGVVADVAAAERAVRDAEKATLEVEARAKQATAAIARTEAQRARIRDLRGKAEVETSGHEEEPFSTDGLEGEAADLDAQIAELEGRLEALHDARRTVRAQIETITKQVSAREAAFARATELRAQADQLEGALAAATTAAPTDDETDDVACQLADARLNLEASRLAAEARGAREVHDDARRVLQRAEEKANELDAVVRRLTVEAPAELLSASDGISGLSFDGDRVLLDGIGIDELCGAEQMKFAIELARRANAKARILVVDGLEQLDPDQYETFVREATKDGYQLIGTRVDRGEVRIQALEFEDTAVAAE